MAPFELSARNVFLTYPQCNISKEEMLEYILTLYPSDYICVAEEKHEDGSPHLHAFVTWTKKHNIRNVRYFDYKGFHPNMKGTRDIDGTLKYVKKDGHFIEHGGKRDFDLYGAAKTMPYEEFMGECLKRKIPYQYANDAVKRRRDQHTIINWDGKGTIAFQIEHNWETRMNVCLYGEAGRGKTVWAKKNAPKPALWITHLDGLKKFDPAVHKSIIFDDVSFTHIPITAQIHLVDYDNPRDIHIRYGVVTIPAEIPKIFCCNQVPLDDKHPAIRRRVRFHIIY